LKLLSNEEPGSDTRLSLVNENGIISKVEKINKEEIDEEIKNTITSILKLVHTIELKNLKNDTSK